MGDFGLSLVRTWVPIAIGAVIAWLIAQGVDIDEGTKDQVVVGLTGIVTAIYYFVIRLLETKWPGAGILLGSTKPPSYPTAPTTPPPAG